MCPPLTYRKNAALSSALLPGYPGILRLLRPQLPCQCSVSEPFPCCILCSVCLSSIRYPCCGVLWIPAFMSTLTQLSDLRACKLA